MLSRLSFGQRLLLLFGLVPVGTIVCVAVTLLVMEIAKDPIFQDEPEVVVVEFRAR